MSSQTLPIGEVCDFNYGDGLKESVRKAGKIPVFGSNGIVGWHDQAITAGPTIIIGRKGSIGEINWSDGPCFPIDTTYYVEKTKLPCDLRWLYFLFKKINLTRFNKSAAVPGLSREDVYEQRIPFPVLAEQKRIAGMLAEADRLRRARRYALELSDTFLPAAFLDLFGDPCRPSNQWDMDELHNLGELDRGRSRHRPRNAPHLYGGPYPFIQTGDVTNANLYIRGHLQAYSEEGLKQSKLWPNGTLCITIAANIAETAILTYPACFPDSIVGFTPSGRVRVEFIQFWLRFQQELLERTAPESAQKNINLEILRELRCPVPSLSKQSHFSDLVARHERLRAKQREALRQADHLFSSLLQEAFSCRN
jgi:type I restriction enzyme S subunit